MDELDEKLVVMDEFGLHVKSEKVAEKLANKKISASMITGLNQCAAKWLADSFVIRELVEEEPDNAARRGSLFHKVMEDFFALEPEERTQAQIKEIVSQTFENDEFKNLASLTDVHVWLRQAINNYYSMGSDPQKVQIAEIVMDESKGPKKGLEVFVKGKIGESKREVLGFIDRLSIDLRKDDGSVIIEDYKSGAKVKKWKSHTKSDDGLAEQRQQLIYKILLENQGIKVSGARLIYPVAKEVVNVDLKDMDLLNRIIKDVENTDKALDAMIEDNTFEYTPSYLCSWCPLIFICPKGTIKPYPKMQEAAAKQPQPEVLLEGIELR